MKLKQRKFLWGGALVLLASVLLAIVIPWISSNASADEANLKDSSATQTEKAISKDSKKSNTNEVVTFDGTGELKAEEVSNKLEGKTDVDVNITGYSSIELWAFNKQKEVKSITISNSVISIGFEAFKDCDKLERVALPSTIQTISDGLFSGCDKLANIIIPSSVGTIGESAFDGCISLTTITIPKNTTSIKEDAFANCNNLTSIYLDGTVGNDCDGIADAVFEEVGVQGTDKTTLYLPAGLTGPVDNNTPWHGGYFKKVYRTPPTTSDFSFNSEKGIVEAGAAGEALGIITNYYKPYVASNGTWTTVKPTEPGSYVVGVVTTGSPTYSAVGTPDAPFTDPTWIYKVSSGDKPSVDPSEDTDKATDTSVEPTQTGDSTLTIFTILGIITVACVTVVLKRRHN